MKAEGVAGGKVNGDWTRARRRRFERSGTGDGREPVLSSGLIWFGREPTWQRLAESLLHHGRKDFSPAVELKQIFKLFDDVQVKVRARHFGVGAKHSGSTSVVLSVWGGF